CRSCLRASSNCRQTISRRFWNTSPRAARPKPRNDRKFQIPKSKIQTESKIQNPKQIGRDTGVLRWILELGIYLDFGIWNLEFRATRRRRSEERRVGKE